MLSGSCSERCRDSGVPLIELPSPTSPITEALSVQLSALRPTRPPENRELRTASSTKNINETTHEPSMRMAPLGLRTWPWPRPGNHGSGAKRSAPEIGFQDVVGSSNPSSPPSHSLRCF